MTEAELGRRYQDYILCLNERRFDALAEFVHDRVIYNGEAKTRAEYRALIAASTEAAPDLRFDIGLIVVRGDLVAAKLDFDCRPKGAFIGLVTDGRRITFSEHVFYRFSDGRIVEVWSLLDRWSVAEQLSR